MKKPFPFASALAFGWNTVQQRPGLLIGMSGVFIAVQFLPDVIALLWDNWNLYALMNASGWALTSALTLGITNITLKLYRRQATGWADLFNQHHLLLRYIGGSLLYSVMMLIGFMLFIVPGIIIALRYFYFTYLMVDENLGIITALKKSAQITKGWTWPLLLFTLLQLSIFFLGMLALGIGMLLALPVIFLAEVYVYQFLLEQSKTQA